MPPKRRPARQIMSEYFGHFFKFLAVFTLIIGISLFLFSFTAGV